MSARIVEFPGGAEDRGRRTEDGGQRTEDRGRRTEDGGQRTEDRFSSAPLARKSFSLQSSVLSPQIRARGLQVDFRVWLSGLERTLAWLDRQGIEIAAFACSTFKGARVHVVCSGRLTLLLAEERVSRGHRHYGDRRIEQWEARDSRTGVLICWEEECRAGGTT